MRQWRGADAGSPGPVGVNKLRIIADDALNGGRNMIAGANHDDHDLRSVMPGEGFIGESYDLRQAAGATFARVFAFG